MDIISTFGDFDVLCYSPYLAFCDQSFTSWLPYLWYWKSFVNVAY